MFRLTALVLGLALALTAAPEAAFAKNKGKGHCPPGLAKKNPPCVPPGLAKKGVGKQYDRDHDRGDDLADRYDRDDYEELRTGDWVRINGQDYIVVRDGDRIVLKRDDTWFDLPGTRDDYVRVGDNLIRVDRKTRAAIEIIRLADLILN